MAHSSLPDKSILAWLPVPFLLLLIVIFKAEEGELISLEAPFVLLGINFVFFTLISLFIASLIGRSFVAQGLLWQLFLGCGVLIWGALGSISVAAGLTPGIANDPFRVNMMVTTYNCGVFLSALCHFASALLLHRRGSAIQRPGLWLAFAYAAALAAVTFIAFAAMEEWLPRFFIPGEGGTPLRQFVLATSIAMFLLAALLMRQQERRCPTPFSHWYTIALVLIAVGLLGVMIQKVTGSLLNWTGRLSQTLGSVYMLIAAIASARETGRWTLTLETALADAQQQFEKLFSLAADGIAVHGVGDDGRWTQFLQVNDALCGMLGYSLDEMRQLTPYDVTANNGAKDTGFHMLLADEKVLHERTLVRKDGGLISAEISTRRFQQAGRQLVMSVVRDVSERKRTETELKKAHDELQNLVRERTTALGEQSRVLEAYFRHSPAPLVFLDRACNFIRVNDAYARACNHDVSYFVGRNHFVEYPSDELREKFMTVVRTGEPYSISNRPFTYPDDPERKVTYWDLYVHPILDEVGEVDFLVCSLTDVTERKLAEDALLEKDYLLLQQSRQAAMGEMINNIAHQWRQPLNALGLNIQRLPLFYDVGEFSAEFLQRSVDDAMMLIQHMSQTIDDFRDFSRPDRQKEEFKLATAIDSAIKLVDATFRSRNIIILTEYEADSAAYGYPNAFSQVMVNLLNNARDAFEAHQTANPRIIICLRTEGEQSVVTVTDNAGGIPEEILYKIFDPHFTTKGPQGTGIGLFMAKNIIERNMNGRLGVRNCGDGAEFRIDL